MAVAPATMGSWWEARLSPCGRKLFQAALHGLILSMDGLCLTWEWETNSSGNTAPGSAEVADTVWATLVLVSEALSSVCLEP